VNFARQLRDGTLVWAIGVHNGRGAEVGGVINELPCAVHRQLCVGAVEVEEDLSGGI
jgi:hypothetical protein